MDGRGCVGKNWGTLHAQIMIVEKLNSQLFHVAKFSEPDPRTVTKEESKKNLYVEGKYSRFYM